MLRRLALCALLAAAGCRSRADAPRVTRGGRAFRRCAAIAPGGPEAWTVGGRALRRDGVTVRDPRPASRPATVLVLGGPHAAPGDGRDPRFARLGERLARVPAHLTVVLGGMGGDPEATRAWFDAVVPRGAPALLVPADVEDFPRYRALVDGLARRHPAVLDGTRVRLFAAHDVEVATLPGAPWTSLARPGGEPCLLDEADPGALAAALGEAHAPRLLATATAPLQRGAFAVDRGVLGVHVGSRAVASLVRAAGARGVVTLLPRESAGTLGDLTGDAPVAPDVGAGSFALSVGTGGADPVETPSGALLGAGAWVVRVAPDRARVDRVE